jgi:LPS-assembly protein
MAGAVCAVAFASFAAGAAQAQSLTAPDGSQLLLAADSLVYDFDGETITAVGGVQISYGETKLVARSVSYDRKSGRLKAKGDVEIIEADGTRIYADELDVTDDFADGFVTALRLETTENTRFAAARATRENGQISVFEKGVYSACEPCADKPEKPLLWQVKAETIVWNQERKTIRFNAARFEMFGLPLAVLPAFEVADHTVKRKSGFLMPTISYGSQLGYSVQIPYFWAVAPNIDVLLKARAYSRQGAFLMGKYTHQLNSGEFTVTMAGIRQRERSAFSAGSEDQLNTTRGMLATTGRFSINDSWTFGWNFLAQTDANFSKTYMVDGFSDTRRVSEVYLTGLGNRNWFDLRFTRFEVQEDVVSGAQKRQPMVLPQFDYRKIADEPVLGGELAMRVNGRLIDRALNDIQDVDGAAGTRDALRGLSGTNGRLSVSTDWQRTVIAPGGLSLTPFAGLRGDAFMTNYDPAARAAIIDEAGHRGVAAQTREAFFRGMATLGLDARWPVLITSPQASHVIEPRAQLLVRPDAPGQSRFGVPNEDAQALVFDASTLFEHDKFSGLDRMEGGVRANVGVRYSGTYGANWTADAQFGQSFHLAGANPYAAPDLVFAGAASGLETNVSDYVASAALNYSGTAADGFLTGVTLGTGARFDEKTFEVRRIDARAAFSLSTDTQATVNYAFIDAQPEYGYSGARRELSGTFNQRLAEHWSANAGATYDLNVNKLSSMNFGLNYNDECFLFGLGYTETRNVSTGARTQTIGFTVNFRTLGDFAQQFALQ